MLNQRSVLNPRLLALLAGAGHLDAVREVLASRLRGVPLRELSHADFKQLTQSARGIIRTGECTPYANVGLLAGVSF